MALNDAANDRDEAQRAKRPGNATAM